MEKQREKEPSPIDPDIERLSKTIENLKIRPYLSSLSNPWKVMWLGFLRGLATGFGTIVGATLLISLAIIIISRMVVHFGGVPVVGEWVRWLGDQLIKK